MEPGHIEAVTVTELEDSLNQIACVRAVRIVASEEGRIEEIHVLGLPGKAPKQLVRDIESALMALYGISLDRRKISIAQIGVADEPEPAHAAPVAVADAQFEDEPRPGDGAAAPAVAPASEWPGSGRTPVVSASESPVASETPDSHPMRRRADIYPIGAAYTAVSRARIVGVDVDTDSMRTTVRVRLADGGGEVSAESSGPAGNKAVLRLVSEATLKAVEQLSKNVGCFAVEDCAVVTLGGRPVVTCSIVTVTSEGEQVLCGSAVVRHTAEGATARATLDALNRRLGL